MLTRSEIDMLAQVKDMKLIEFDMPECVAAYAMYGSDSAVGDEIETAYDQWMDDTMRHEGFKSMHLIDVKQEPGFMSYHELKEYGIGSADCATFVYDVTQ